MNRYSRRCHVHGGAGRKLLRERFGRAACGALSGSPTAREVALHLASIARHPPDRKHGGCARRPKIPPRRRDVRSPGEARQRREQVPNTSFAKM